MFKIISFILYLLHLEFTLCDEFSNNYLVNRFKKQNYNYQILSQDAIQESSTTMIESSTISTSSPELHLSLQSSRLERKIQINDSFCGIMSTSAGLVQGGELSKRNQFPWMAIIKHKNDDGEWVHEGSGSLISSRHVVVASYSVSYLDSSNKLIPVDVESIKILLGTTKFILSDSGSLEVNVLNIANLPNSKEVLTTLDINLAAVITLDREITFTEFIRPVCLWPFGDDLNDIIGRDAFAVGYGVDQTGKHSLNRKHVRMTVTGIDDACKYIFVEELAFQNETKLFCIKASDNETPCFYDEQLYMKVESRWYLKGLLTVFNYFDDEKCSSKKPVLCEDIAPIVPWIQNQTLITAKMVTTMVVKESESIWSQLWKFIF